MKDGSSRRTCVLVVRAICQVECKTRREEVRGDDAMYFFTYNGNNVCLQR